MSTDAFILIASSYDSDNEGVKTYDLLMCMYLFGRYIAWNVEIDMAHYICIKSTNKHYIKIQEHIYLL